MTLTEQTPVVPPRTFLQIIAAVLRNISDRVDPPAVAIPSVDDIKAEQRLLAEVALLDAEMEEERYRHTAAMLNARIRRLSCLPSHHSSDSFEPSLSNSNTPLPSLLEPPASISTSSPVSLRPIRASGSP